MASPDNKKNCFPGKTGIKELFVYNPLKINLCIEVDPTAGAKTDAKFSLGKSTDIVFQDVPKSKVTKEGKIYSTSIPETDSLLFSKEGMIAYIRPCKSKLLRSYNEKNGLTEFRIDPYPTAELMAEINVFTGNRCLTSRKTFDEIKNEMKESTAGLNKILIRLDDMESQILDFIIDGIIYIENGIQKVHTKN